MDPWDIVTEPWCPHLRVMVQPGRTADDPVDGYCEHCGEKVGMGGMTWRWYELERRHDEMSARDAEKQCQGQCV